MDAIIFVLMGVLLVIMAVARAHIRPVVLKINRELREYHYNWWRDIR